MSEKMKSRLEVQKIVRDNILSGFEKLGLSGWDVKEFANAHMTKADKVVLMNYIRTRRVGWQGRTYAVSSESLKRSEEWIAEQHWQIHCIAKRPSSPNAATVLSEDMADILVAWFSTPESVDLFRASGIAPLRVSGNDVIVYTDNSDLYQKRAVFTLKLQVPKSMDMQQPDVSSMDEYSFKGVYGV